MGRQDPGIWTCLFCQEARRKRSIGLWWGGGSGPLQGATRRPKSNRSNDEAHMCKRLICRSPTAWEKILISNFPEIFRHF